MTCRFHAGSFGRADRGKTKARLPCKSRLIAASFPQQGLYRNHASSLCTLRNFNTFFFKHPSIICFLLDFLEEADKKGDLQKLSRALFSGRHRVCRRGKPSFPFYLAKFLLPGAVSGKPVFLNCSQLRSTPHTGSNYRFKRLPPLALPTWVLFNVLKSPQVYI